MSDPRRTYKIVYITCFIIGLLLWIAGGYFFIKTDDNKLLAGGLFFWGFVSFIVSVIFYTGLKRCIKEMWNSKKNVILPSTFTDPYSSNVNTVCSAQKLIQGTNYDAFYYDSKTSNVWVIDSDITEPDVTVSNVATTITMYYTDDVKPKFRSPSTSSSSSSGGGSPSPSPSPSPPPLSASCCFRDSSDACITFEQTFLGGQLSSSVKDVFVSRAGNNYGTVAYIGDFTAYYQFEGTTRLVYTKPTNDPMSDPTVTTTKPVSSTFAWPTCAPQFVTSLTPKMISDILPQYEKIVKVDTWLMKAYIDHLTYILRNGSPNSFYPIRDGPWKYPMEVKGNIMFGDNSTVVKYNNVFYTGTTAITTTLRNILIAE